MPRKNNPKKLNEAEPSRRKNGFWKWSDEGFKDIRVPEEKKRVLAPKADEAGGRSDLFKKYFEEKKSKAASVARAVGAHVQDRIKKNAQIAETTAPSEESQKENVVLAPKKHWSEWLHSVSTFGSRREKSEPIINIRSLRPGGEKDGKISHMKIGMVIFMGYRNLRMSKLRSFLTIGGVAIGIAIITFLICIGFGIQQMVVREVTKSNRPDVIDINNKNLENFVVINEETRNRISGIEGVQQVEQLLETGGKTYFEASQTDAIVFGVQKGYFDLGSIVLLKGTSEGFASEEGVAIMSTGLAGVLGFNNPEEILDKEIEVAITLSSDISDKVKAGEMESENRGKVKVIGLIDNRKDTFLYLPCHFLQEEFGVTAAQSAKVKVDIAKVDIVRSQIEQMGFITDSIIDLVADINSFFTIIRIIMIVLGTIIMSISAMGMLNTLSVSLLQRTREVGILKALGAKRNDVFKMFVFEAALISFAGGVLGFFGGWVSAKSLNLIFNMLASRKGYSTLDFVYIPYYFIVAIVIFIFFLGLVTGLLPARRASRIHALDALRYE